MSNENYDKVDSFLNQVESGIAISIKDMGNGQTDVCIGTKGEVLTLAFALGRCMASMQLPKDMGSMDSPAGLVKNMMMADMVHSAFRAGIKEALDSASGEQHYTDETKTDSKSDYLDPSKPAEAKKEKSADKWADRIKSIFQ